MMNKDSTELGINLKIVMDSYTNCCELSIATDFLSFKSKVKFWLSSFLILVQ